MNGNLKLFCIVVEQQYIIRILKVVSSSIIRVYFVLMLSAKLTPFIFLFAHLSCIFFYNKLQKHQCIKGFSALKMHHRLRYSLKKESIQRLLKSIERLWLQWALDGAHNVLVAK